MNIPAGYQLHIETWENDGDAYNTEIINGLMQEDCKFLIELASKFTSKNDQRSKGLGNGGVNSEILIELFKETLSKHPNVTPTLVAEVLYDGDEPDEDTDAYVYNWLCETLLGYPQDEYYRYDYTNFCRAFSSFEVYYIPEEIEEVTKEFKGE